MIGDFLRSWDLFHLTYLAGWLTAILLSLLGVLVVARDQIFLGASISQASTFGLAIAMWLPSVRGFEGIIWLHGETFPTMTAVLFSVAAAVLTARGGEAGQESRESITGWVFLVSAAGAILVVSHSPHGLEEVHRLVTSTIIGATTNEVLIVAGVLVVSLVTLIFGGRRLLLVTLDPTTAAALGLRVNRWSLLFSAWLGLAVGLAIGVSGMLYTFGTLVLPALIAKNVCREVRSMFFVAPALALAGTVLAFVVANDGDYPPGQMAVVVLALLLLAAWILRFLGKRVFARA